jgi:hypothetical protein
VVDLHPASEASASRRKGRSERRVHSGFCFCVPAKKRKIFFFQKSLADKKKAVHLQPLWETGRTKKNKEVH